MITSLFISIFLKFLCLLFNYFVLFSEANEKRPKPEEVRVEVDEFMRESLQEIMEEKGNDERTKFVSKVLNLTGSSRWRKFVKAISEPLVINICKPSKVIPSNQLEDQMVTVNKLLCDTVQYSALVEMLSKLSSESIYGESNVPGMVLFRLVHKFSDKLLGFVFDKMKSGSVEQEPGIDRIKSVHEEVAFKVHMQKLVQHLYIKGLHIGSKSWLAKCAVIRKNFIDVKVELEEQAIIRTICQDSSWEENKDGDVIVSLTEDCLEFFINLEEIIESLLKKTNVDINCDVVLSIMFEPVNAGKLNLWYALSENCLSEVESIMFLKELATLVIDLSLRFEVNRLRRKQDSNRIQKYALRTDLKRN